MYLYINFFSLFFAEAPRKLGDKKKFMNNFARIFSIAGVLKNFKTPLCIRDFYDALLHVFCSRSATSRQNILSWRAPLEKKRIYFCAGIFRASIAFLPYYARLEARNAVFRAYRTPLRRAIISF